MPIPVIVALTLALSGLILAVNQAHSSAVPASPAQDKAKVIVKEIQPSDDTRRLLVPVKVEAKVSSLVTAEAEGFVTKIAKPLGSKVKAGDVVLFIENKDPAFTYAKVPVRSPVAGVVSQLLPALMSRVSRGDKLFVVMNPKELKLSAEIPGSELGLVQPGSKGVFKKHLDQENGSPIKLTGISPLVDPRTGTASAELEFAPEKGKEADLPSIGMVGHALFEMSRGKVLLIPESALGYNDGKPTVKILDGQGLVQRKQIELGEQKESLLVVKSGLEAGAKVIVRANRKLSDGESVEVDSGSKAN